MTDKDFIKKAKEFGLSEDEILTFIENQKTAQKYGFFGEFSSINVKIDKKKQDEMENFETDNNNSECNDCDCKDCHCHNKNCKCHNHN